MRSDNSRYLNWLSLAGLCWSTDWTAWVIHIDAGSHLSLQLRVQAAASVEPTLTDAVNLCVIDVQMWTYYRLLAVYSRNSASVRCINDLVTVDRQTAHRDRYDRTQ